MKAILPLKWERMEPLGVWFADRLAEMILPGERLVCRRRGSPSSFDRDPDRQRGCNQAG